GPEPGNAALAVDADVHDEVAPGLQSDPRVLLVDRVAFEDAAVGLRVFEELRAVPDLHRLQPRDPGADHLPPAAVPGHQVRLDQPCCDLQLGPGVAVVDPDRDAVVGGAEV